jgi:hypothetical protein
VDPDPVEQAAPRAGPQAHQARYRDPPGALAGYPHHGRVPAGRPGPGPRRPQVLPGLVLKADIRPGRRREPRTFAQVTARHAAIASSSRSAARCTGTCGLNPSRCSSSDVPRSVYRMRNSRPISAATRSSVHRWSSLQPHTAGPASSAARSRSSCAPLSRHAAPPGPLDASAARPPSRQRRRHAYAELHETRSRRATSGGVTPSANHSAACNRTLSRLARPAADRPPPSGYLIPLQ